MTRQDAISKGELLGLRDALRTRADLDDDGTVNANDLAILLGDWGAAR